MSKAVIVIPTYNEAGSIGAMLDYLNEKTFPQIASKQGDLSWDWQMSIVVVDDTSPDGTGKIVASKAKKYANVFLLSRPAKSGIGSAFMDGFKYAMEKLSADYVFEMDGDFQHPPETIFPALKAVEDGFDYVIGSRKIKGGSNPKGWGFKRLFFSEIGGLTARFVLFFPFKHFWDVTDPTSGFRITKVKGVLDRLNLNKEHLYTKSFGYKIQLLYETLATGAKYIEVPLEFKVRDAGESKIEPQTAKEVLIAAIKTRCFDPATQRFLKFAVVGGTGLVIQTAFFEYFGVITNTLSPSVATTIGGELAIISNFTLNNLWTFKEFQVRGLKIITKFFQFNFTSLLALAIQFTVLKIGEIVAKGNPLIIQFFYFGALIIVIITNYYIYNKFIWKTNRSK